MSHSVVMTLVLLVLGREIVRACSESAVFVPAMQLRTIPYSRSSFPGMTFGVEVPQSSFESQFGAHSTTPPTMDSARSESEQVASDVAAVEQFQDRHGNESSIVSVQDLLDAIGLDAHDVEVPEARASESFRDHDPVYTHYPEYPYPPHGYWQPPPPPVYQPYHYVPAPVLPPPKPLKPLLPVLPKPAAVLPKPSLGLSGKLPGLLGLIQSLLGGKTSTGTGLGAAGGLLSAALQPLLESKKNLKSLIGKLSVPLIVLLLINVELLALIWWLWEDCAVVVPAVKHDKAPAPEAHSTYPGYYYRSAQLGPQQVHHFYR